MKWYFVFIKSLREQIRDYWILLITISLAPFFVFMYLMLVRWAFLDGMPGIRYSMMRATYEFMIDLKVKELRLREKGLSV